MFAGFWGGLQGPSVEVGSCLILQGGGLASVNVNLNTRYRLFKAEFISNKFTQRCSAIGRLENGHNLCAVFFFFFKVERHVIVRRNRLREVHV